MTKIVLLTAALFVSTACIKTADQVNRERRLESMTEQMKDSQGLVADLVTQMKDMQSQLDRLNGRLEEMEYRQKQVDPQNIVKMNETMNVMKTQQETESQQLLQIQNELKEQRAFLEKVTASLAAVKESAPKEKSSKKKALKKI